MKKQRFLSIILATVLVLSLSAFGAGTAIAEDIVEASDVDLQIGLIASQLSKLTQTDGQNTWYYTIADLDHDGNLEFIAASRHPQDRSTNLKIWQVSADRKAMTECTLTKDPEESFPDLLTDTTDTYHDTQTDTWFYLLDDNIVISNAEVYTVKTAVSLKNAAVGYDAYAVEHTVLDNGYRSVSHTDINGIEISADQYNAAVNNALAGMDRSNTAFEWLTAEDTANLTRLTDSYAVFTGAKAPTEVFPVPKPAALEEPAATPTPAPAATPVPVQNSQPVYLSVTKNPTNENRKVGGNAIFVACANAYESLNWTFVSPSGGEYSPANFLAGSGASITGEYSTTITVNNVEDWMNGWGAYCTFYYQGQTARTSTAYIYVTASQPAPAPSAKSGVSYGTVNDIKYTYVTIWLDEGFSVLAEWNVVDLNGDIYYGAPATVYWDGSKDHVTYCVIQGSQSAPQTVYGSMSGYAYSGGGGYAISLLNGTQVFVDSWKCNVSGDFYEGCSCVVYYTDSPSNSTVYQADIYGAEPARDYGYTYGDTYIYEMHETYNPDGSTYDTVTCPNCGREVSMAYDDCPYCGFPLWN